MKKIEDKYKVLDHISHVILRPQTYVGSNKPNTSIKYIYDSESNKMIRKEVTYIPSFLKIFDEVITNSVDEHKREPKKLNRVDVIIDIDNSKISIKDNGGIPVVIHKEHKQYVPEVIFGNLMSGTNYDDSEDRIVAGTNGLGSKLTSIFSKEFNISTCDGKNHFFQTFSNNMRERSKPIIKKSNKNHTEISYIPDLEKFGLTKIDEDHFKIIEKRVYDIAACNPNLKIYFNNKLINIKSFEDYIKLYTTEYFYETKKDNTWSVGIALSENGFQQVSFVNSTETYDGGTHVEYIMNQIISSLREFFLKKHKVDVRPSELRQHMFLFLDSMVVNPSFSAQTKEKLITEVKSFGSAFEISQKLISSILKSEIVNSILDWIQQKKNAEENKLQRDLNKKLSKIKVEKLIDAKGKDRWKYSIGLFEGDSAISAFRKYRDPQTMGAFALKGKFVNVSEMTNSKLIQNEEVVNLMAAIGLKLGQSPDVRDLRYGRIFFYCDADTDGNSIVGLLLNFFYKYWPEMFDRRMIYKVDTPIVVAIPKSKGKNKVLFYSQTEYNDWLLTTDTKSYELKYKKGLAALVDDEYKDIINSPRITLITKDDISTEYLDIWFGKNSDLRKIELLK
jgi:DNA topoisomerase II